MRNRLEIVADEFDANRVKLQNVDFEGYMKARDADKNNVKKSDDFKDDLIARMYGEKKSQGISLPWMKCYGKFEFRKGEISTWMGFNGHMKSMVLGQVMLDLIKQDERVCVMSFEMKPTSTLIRMVHQAVGSANPTVEYINKFFNWSSDKLWFYDQMGTVNPDRIIGVIYYCAEQLGITNFLIDSLMKCVVGEDDMNGQKMFVDKLCAAARELNIHINLIHHSRKKEDERKRPGKQDAKGSGSIVDQTDNFMVIFKIPKDLPDDSKPDYMIYFDKQRGGEWEGQISLWFDNESFQFCERPKHLIGYV